MNFYQDLGNYHKTNVKNKITSNNNFSCRSKIRDNSYLCETKTFGHGNFELNKIDYNHDKDKNLESKNQIKNDEAAGSAFKVYNNNN